MRIIEKKTLLGIDYFGNALNLAYRLLDLSLPNRVYLSEDIYNILPSKNRVKFIGLKKIRGINKEVKVYSLIHTYMDDFPLNNVNLSEKIKSIDETIFNISCICAIIAIQPGILIDLATIFVLQVYMIMEISKKYGFKIDEKAAYTIMLSLIVFIGLSYVKGWAQLELYKMGLPGLGGYIQVPLVFSMVYGFGKLVSYKYYNDYIGNEISTKQVKNYYLRKKTDAFYYAKKIKIKL